MKRLFFTACSVLAAVFSTVVITYANHDSADLASQATSPDKEVSQKAREALRDMGPQGLQALQERYASEINVRRNSDIVFFNGNNGVTTNEQWHRIAAALDKVGGQYDNYASGLYWYTDLEKAKAAAHASGKPILSLRLLGRLDEDLSCANSRFFRTTLYPSADINKLLKERFILYWESERPAPRVTIDFGDGRKLQRTITGNSIHYILDSDGNLVDALPGLYAAPVFAAELQQAADAAQAGKNHDYSAHMQSTQARLLQAWVKDLGAIHVIPPVKTPLTQEALTNLMDDNKWQQLAGMHQSEVTFDNTVTALVDSKFPTAVVAAPISMSKMAVESPMVKTLSNLSRNVSLDTVRNNYMLRTKILAMLLNQNERSWTLAQINDWIYAKVFLTPRQDPWLGLAPPDVYAALDNNGEIQ